MKRLWLMGMAAVLLCLNGCQGKTNQEEEEEVIPMPSEEETEEVKEYDVELSEKLSDFQFAINGEVKVLPSEMKKWEAEGWEYTKEDADTSLEGESYAEGKKIQKEEAVLLIDAVNLDSENRKLQECYIGGITLENQEGQVYQLPGGITLGKSTLGQVEKAYGTPEDEYEEKEDVYLTYEFGIYKEADFVFDIETETLKRAVLKNYRAPEDQEEEVSKEVPEEVERYESPEGFSSNPLDYVVSYDGNFYKIPAPVSEFLENGWKVEKEGSDMYVKPGRHGYVTLEKKGKKIYGVVRNYGEKSVEIKNTFMTNLSGDFEVTKIPISVGDEICLGMEEDEIKIRLGGTAYEEKEEEGGTAYICYSDDTKKNYVKILLDKDLGLVREIQVSNSPQSLMPVQEEQGGETDSSVLTEEIQTQED